MAITSTANPAVATNHVASGTHLDTAGTTAASIDIGFVPAVITVENETDRIQFEWRTGMTTAYSVKTAAAGTRTLETSGCITISGTTIGFPVITAKQYRWIAIG